MSIRELNEKRPYSRLASLVKIMNTVVVVKSVKRK